MSKRSMSRAGTCRRSKFRESFPITGSEVTILPNPSGNGSAMSTLTPTVLKVAPTEKGCVIHLEGRGTMKESPAAGALANQTLAGDPGAIVVMDLSACTYLDSTFLGCIAALYGRYGRDASPRFFVAGSP